MGKKHITVSYNNESGDYNQSLDVARSPRDDHLLQHRHFLQSWMKKIYNDLMNWNEALKNDPMQNSSYNLSLFNLH